MSTNIENFSPEQEQSIFAELNNLLEAEPSSSQIGSVTGIPELREELALLVVMGKAKEALGKNLTHKEVQCLSNSDVKKYAQRYKAFLGARTNKSLTDSVIFLGVEAIGKVLPIKDKAALRQDFKDDFIINHELSKLSDAAALKLGRGLAAANAVIIVAKNVDYDALAEQYWEEDRTTPTKNVNGEVACC